MQTVEQRHTQSSREFFASWPSVTVPTYFRAALAEHLAIFEASLPPSAPVDRDAVTEVTPAMQAAWCAFEPAGQFSESMSFARFNGMLRHAFLSGYAAALPPSGIAEMWQPIETAPDDLSDFLVGWVGRHTVKIATFNADGGLVELEDFAGWIEGGEPTHWRPLPAPPADLSNKGVG